MGRRECSRALAIPREHSERGEAPGRRAAMLDLISTAVTQLRLRDREDGQAMVEYALILALVSIAAIVVLGQIGTDVNTVFTSVHNALNGA